MQNTLEKNEYEKLTEGNYYHKIKKISLQDENKIQIKIKIDSL